MTTWNSHRVFHHRRIAILFGSLGFVLSAAAVATPARAQDPFVDAVVSFVQGTSGGFGASSLPDVVLGPPRGGGPTQGGLNVVSLGIGGSIVLRFGPRVICDGSGPDFTLFENAFRSGASGPVFTEYGFVAVSQDGVSFIEFPHDSTGDGLAGRQPVLSNPDNGVDPLDPAVSGGDLFDLSTVGLPWAAYVRITDVAGAIPDTGDLPQFAVPPSAGFDLDAAAALHPCEPGVLASPTPAPSPTPTPAPATSTATPTLTAAAAHRDAAIVPRRPARLRIRAGQSAAAKRMRVKVRNADAAGDLPIHLSGAGCSAATVGVGFGRWIVGAEDRAIVRAGRTRTAIVSVEVSSAAIATPDRRAPVPCRLTFVAAADVAGNVDPTPDDNVIEVELNVLDLNDVDQGWLTTEASRPASTTDQQRLGPVARSVR